MSHWDGQQTIRWPSKSDEDYPGWTWIDCGCYAGLQWGVATDYPVECPHCAGGGMVCRHEVSGALALWPGGPFVGRTLGAGAV